MTAALDGVATFVRDRTGIAIAPSQHASLAAAIARIAPELDAAQLLESVDRRADADDLVERLIDEITVQETYFLRAPRELAAIDWHALAVAARARGDSVVRVWCAACSTGEEAYTLALLAAEALGAATSGAPPVDVLATDVSRAALARAAAGSYGANALRHVDDDRRARFFVTEGRRLVVAPRLRSVVRLARHNLARDPFPPRGEPSFDAIVCRNVFMYLEEAAIERAVAGLERARRPGGELVLGAVDRLAVPARTPAAEPGHRVEPGARRPAARDHDPLDADASYARGLAELDAGAARGAIPALRRALYLRPTFALAAFQLGRAYDATGDERAALRSYRHALALLDAIDPGSQAQLAGADAAADVRDACRTRITALAREE